MTEAAFTPDDTPAEPVLRLVPESRDGLDEEQAAREWADEQAVIIGNRWLNRPDRDGLVTP